MIISFASLFAIACGGPLLMFPGGRLSGDVVTEPVSDWSFVDDRSVDLETRPSAPSSVEINYTIKNGNLYIDPTEGRNWLDHIREDGNLRVRFGTSIYPVKAVLVEEPAELEGFGPQRFVYRLDSR